MVHTPSLLTLYPRTSTLLFMMLSQLTWKPVRCFPTSTHHSIIFYVYLVLREIPCRALGRDNSELQQKVATS
jgi:hypothetical protein